ncbi:MAG: sugar ABC transporter permease [Clostridia bacterium]|nr:sugar ABC transporter permease [Clostridia bacterium]
MKTFSSRSRFIFLSLCPAVILFTVFIVLPTFNVFRISLYKWGGYSAEKEFVGFDNFRILFSDMKFLRSVQNSLFLIVFVTVITLSISLIFASILVHSDIRGKSFFRVVFYIPNILSIIVISSVFSAIYQPGGHFDSVLSHFGKTEPVLWLGNKKTVVLSLAIALIWQAVGYYMVMYMASISNIPKPLYENAELEGASKFHQFFSITIPLIWSNIRTTLTFFIISSVNLSFLLVRAMTGGGPDGASEVFLSYMYKQAYTNSSYGYGMAIGVVVFIITFSLSGIVNLATSRKHYEY